MGAPRPLSANSRGRSAAGEMNKLDCEQLHAFFASNCPSRSSCSRDSGETMSRARQNQPPPVVKLRPDGSIESRAMIHWNAAAFQRHPCPAHHVPKNPLSERKTRIYKIRKMDFWNSANFRRISRNFHEISSFLETSAEIAANR